MIKVSIVTVCFNEQVNIARTMESVLSQTAGEFEYIICDGGSTDRTVEIAESYRKKFEDRGITFWLSSKKDGGIYFGMNNGINQSRGQYILFINAGDQLHRNTVLQEIYDKVDFERKMDVWYGDVAYYERGFLCRYIVGNHINLKKSMSVCHPAVLVSGEILRSRGFDTRYRFAADYNLLLDLFMDNCTFQHIDVVIADFQAGGVSNINQEEIWKDNFEIWDRHGIEYSPEEHIRRARKNGRILKLKLMMPEWLWDFWNTKIKHKEKYLG